MITARQCRRSGAVAGRRTIWPRRAAARRRLRRGRGGQRSVAAVLGGRPRPVSQAVRMRRTSAGACSRPGEPRREAGWPNRKWRCRDAARDGRCCRRRRQLVSPETGEGPAPLVEHAVVIVRDRRARSAPGAAEARHPTPRLIAADGSDKRGDDARNRGIAGVERRVQRHDWGSHRSGPARDRADLVFLRGAIAPPQPQPQPRSTARIVLGSVS